MTSALEDLERLRAGNARFVAGRSQQDSTGDVGKRLELADGQNPYAIVLGCADSRVPAERVFDQGLGDLFVVRVAGNVAMPTQIGSIEFAAAQLGARLIVVLGHTQCGAVLAAVDATCNGNAPPTDGLATIVDEIRPAVEATIAQGASGEDIGPAAVEENVRRTVRELPLRSPLLADLAKNEGLVIVGAKYSLAEGTVEFLDAAPSS